MPLNICENKKINTVENIIERLVCNESFIKYCKGVSDADIEFWDNWIAERPALRESFQHAKDIVSTLSMNISGEECAAEKERLLKFISKSEM